MTSEEYKIYEKTLKESLKKTQNIKTYSKNYKTKINKLLELYDDYKFPTYRSIIKELRDKNKPLEYIENALINKIKKKLDDVADTIDKKYRPSYKGRSFKRQGKKYYS